jgi:O-antigen/teichoic acid export membrane protein
MKLPTALRGLLPQGKPAGFLANVLAVSGSALAVQLISVLSAPITARLYAPADHGLLALFSAAFSLLCILATLRYEAALPLAKTDQEAAHLLALGALLTLVVSALVALACLLFPAAISGFVADDPRVSHYLWFLPLGVLLPALFTLFTAGAVRAQHFGTLGKARLVQAVAGTATSIGCGLGHVGVLGLIAGTLVTWVVGLRSVGSAVLRSLHAEWRQLRWQGLLEVARLHYRFPLFNTGAQFINAASLQVPVFLLAAYAGAAATGWFSLTQRLLLLPTLLISGAITPVFYSRAREAHADGTLAAFAQRVLNAICGANVFFVVFVALFGEPLFALVFGTPWTRSGTYAAAMAPWLLVNFMVTPLATLPLVFARQKADLLFHAALLAARAGLMWAAAYWGNDLTAVLAFSLGSAALLLVYLGWLLHLVHLPLVPVLSRVLRELLLAGVLLGACRWVWAASGENLWLTGAALAPVLGFGAWRALGQLRTLNAA